LVRVLALLRLASTKLLTYSHAKLLATLNSLYAKTREKVLGNKHPGTLISIANLASTYSNQGRWKEAEQLQVQVVETVKRVLGDEHPHTLSSMASLTITYWKQGRWKEAKALFVQVTGTRKSEIGEKHPNMLANINN
jgi:hypothetical protein